jgi:cellular nucleic acid-binding protein
MYQIYVLELKSKKYYIGITENLEDRIRQHFNGKGSEWTKLYSPIKVLKTVVSNSKYDEDNITKEYMNKYGINNVRGGSYVKIILDPLQKYNLQKEIWNSNGLCLRCGRSEHRVQNCYAKTNVEGEMILELDSDSDSDSDCCYRCGRTGHHVQNCYAKTNIEGEMILEPDSDSDCCYRCGRLGHYASDCYAKTDVNRKRI